jgi:hypothetical protein
MNRAETEQPSNSGISGKLVIVGIVSVAVLAAAISWFFRYNATHRTAMFFGPEAVALIRDAPQVTLIRLPLLSLGALACDPNPQVTLDKNTYDISEAHGLVHLRNALLEDHNYRWPEGSEKPAPKTAHLAQYWVLHFGDREHGKAEILEFTEDCRQAWQTRLLPNGKYEPTPISTEPMAKGLREMFAEFSAVSPTPSAEPAR